MNINNINNLNAVKVVLLGDSGVGKTSIILRLINQIKQIYDHGSTIGASFFIKAMQFNDQQINLHLWDTAGQERFKSLARIYYKDASACLCVFDVSNIDSFKNINQWIKDYKENNIKKHVIYLIANKCDLPELSWCISKKEIQHFADNKNIKIFYTSSWTNINIENTFQELIGDIIKIDSSIISTNINKTNKIINVSKPIVKKSIFRC